MSLYVCYYVGKVSTIQVNKQGLANELGLPLRDLRVVDPSIPKQIRATFITRPKAILFCIENIKVVVRHNRTLVFGPYQAEVQEFIPVVQQLIAQAAAGDDAGWQNRARYETLVVALLPHSHLYVISAYVLCRFEHLVLEAAMNVVCTNLFKRVRALSPAVTSTLKALQAESRGLQDVITTQVDELLPLKNKLDELRKRVKEIKRAMTDVVRMYCNNIMWTRTPTPSLTD
jgi:hypothetical protein